MKSVTGRGRSKRRLLLTVAVLGLFSLTGCASAPYMPNPVDVAAGSGDDPFAGTKWEYTVEGAGVTYTQAGDLNFYNDGTVSWSGTKPKNYTVISGDSGYMAEIKGGLLTEYLWLTIDKSNASEGNIKVQMPVLAGGATLRFTATRK